MQRSTLWLAGGAAFLVVAVFAGALVGPVHLGVVDVVRGTFAHAFGLHSPLSRTDDAILWQIRLPRVVLGAIVGATLAVIYAPASALAGDLLPLAAFAGAAVAVVAAYVLGRSAGAGVGSAALVLAGVTIASFLTAVQTFVQQQHVDTVQEVYSWLLGRLSTSGWHEVGIVLPYAAASWLILLGHRRLLDVLAVGDEEAAALGVNVPRVRLLVVSAATIATAAAVAVSGLIGFVGIIVPHTIRLLTGGSYRLLLPMSLLVGAAFLVLADVLARTVMSPGELPIGVVTAFFGAPFFAIVLRRSRRAA